TGFGKTGRMFGFETFDFEPDLFVIAKGLSSGYFPISAVAVGSKVGDLIQNTDETLWHVFTNSGHPVGAAVALANIAYIEENKLIARVSDEIDPHFRRRLAELDDLPCVKAVWNLGVLGGIAVDASRAGQVVSPKENGVFVERVLDLAWEAGVAMR